MREKAEEIYGTMRHYPPSNRIWERWQFMQPNGDRPRGVTHREHTVNRIQELLEKGYAVKYGWCASSMVRNYREYWIFYKKAGKGT